ncbi:MAG TPA: TadE/TadG family type IV pilus assembly protein [Pirellulales bacterium]|jgi:Flp pilus assembly protein TadG|nr:TadE/TadG family type IV pilus assembly protein [Pirellulales bacterium]
MLRAPKPRAARRRLRQRRGAAVVEAALLLPVVLTLLLGMWEIGRMVEVYQVLNNAVREGGRQAAAGQLSNSQVQQVVTYYLAQAGLTTTNVTVTVSDLTTPGTDATDATELDQLKIIATIPFADVRWSPATLVTNSTTTLSVTQLWYSNNNQAYPTNISVPPAY